MCLKYGPSTSADEQAKGTELLPQIPTAQELASPLDPAQGCPNGATSLATAPGYFVPLSDPTLQIVQTPNDNAPLSHCHQGVIDAIHGATKSIQMTMFHLTDQAVIQELVAAAQRIDPKTQKPIQVQVILDPTCPDLQRTLATLNKAGIQATASSPCFNMTHEKAFVIDAHSANPTSFFGAMNMTGEDQLGKTGSISPPSTGDICESTRDFDVITHDPVIAGDLNRLFQTDYASAVHTPPYVKGDTCPEPNPPLQSPSLVLSPMNSEAKLVSLIQSSWNPAPPPGTAMTIQCTAENWGDPAIQKALLAAAANQVHVQLIAPQCDQNPDPTYDFDQPKTLPMLIGHDGIEVSAMPAPPSHEKPYQPYMHSKMCRINNSVTYIGSVNFSVQSTQHNRELGLIFKDTATSGTQLDAAFTKDFAAANPVTTLPVASKFLECTKASSP